MASTYPYRLGSEPFDYIAESCNSTASVSHHVVLGLEKVFTDVHDFREQCPQFRVTYTPKLALEKFPALQFLGELPTGTPQEAAGIAYEQITARWPQLAKYQPKKVKRKGRPKDPFRSKRQALVAEADKLGIKDVDLMKHLDQKCAPMPWSWKLKHCPPTWQDAFSDPKWRETIQKQLCTLRKTSG
jgi:hypothetical protein